MNTIQKLPACPAQHKTEESFDLPHQHPFTNHPEEQTAYEKLLGQLMQQPGGWCFPPIYNPSVPPALVRKMMQETLPIVPDPGTQLTLSDQTLLKQPNAFAETTMVALLRDLVSINSQTKDEAGNRRVREKIAAELEKLGFQIRHYPKEGVTVAELIPSQPAQGKKILLIGHTDTVLSPASFPMPICQDDQDIVQKIHGPGVADMKGGLVVMLTALQALHSAGLLAHRRITVLLNSDEEVGSPKSKALIEEAAKKNDVGMVFESGKPTVHTGGGLTLARKGILFFDITITGRGAHAGVDHYRGIDAGRISARIMESLSALTDYAQGTTVNIGVIQTNEEAAGNAVIKKVHLEGEFRFWKPEEQKILQEKAELLIRGAMACNPFILYEQTLCSDYQVTFKSVAPTALTPERANWFAQIAALGKQIDMDVDAVTSGGLSNQNTAGSVGLNVIDSFGPVGSGTHTSEERVDLKTLLSRAQLAALVMQHAFETTQQTKEALWKK